MNSHRPTARPDWRHGIALAAVMSPLLAGDIAAAADAPPTHQAVTLEHITIETRKPFAEVAAALERALPPIDDAIRQALAAGDEGRAKQLEGETKLYIFLKRDPGELLQITGQAAHARQYEIGNPLTATRMMRHRLSAALYAPLRVLLAETASGTTTFEYDRPSTLFGQFGDKAVTAVGRELDDELERALRQAAE